MRGLRRSGVTANVVGAVVIFVATAGVGGGDQIPDERRGELVAVFVAFVTLGVGFIATVLSRVSRPLVDPVAEGRPIVGRTRMLLLALPAAYAAASAGGWLVAAPLFALHSWWRLDAGTEAAVALAVTIAAGGLTTGGTVYLLVERVVRPLYARAFAVAAPTRARALGVRLRVLLAWLLGSVVPLLLMTIVVADQEASLADVRTAVFTWVIVAIIAGFALSTRAARSIAEPLSAVRVQMAQVAEGDLDAAVAVDDASELGLLQAGFNEMAAGLRERERLRDLFGRHVGTEVARRSLEAGVALGGEQRRATVLFIDLVGFTTTAAATDPTEVVRLLNRVFEAVVRATEQEGGWVNKFQGDAALCVFGPPSGHDDHAGAALRAALAIHRDLLAAAGERSLLDAGIGVSTGDVVAGNVGSAQRFEYTVIGDPVNEAARLTEEAKTRPGRVLASDQTVRDAGTPSGWRPCGPVALKGRPHPTEAWEPEDRSAPTLPA